MNITLSPYTNEYQKQTINHIISIQKEELNMKVTHDERDDLSQIEEVYMKNDKGSFILALYNNNVVGTISILNISNNKCALQNMYIHKDFRGTMYNTANKLLKETLNFAQEHKMKEIYLGTGLDFYAAHKFYERNGFMEVSRKTLPSNFPFMSVDEKFFELIL